MKIESEAESDDPFEVLKAKLMERYNHPHSRAESIKRIVHQTARDFGALLGDRAEFWLLLSVGSLIGQPHQIYGSEAAIYKSRARDCDDMTAELELQYAEILCEQLDKRQQRSPAALGIELAHKYNRAHKSACESRENLKSAYANIGN